MADERVVRHRDLTAHAFRWAHVAGYLQQSGRYKDAIVLDVGCGRFMPLAKMLYSNRLIPRQYVGVDANKFDIPEMLVGKKIPVSIWSETDFCALAPEDVGLKILGKDDQEGPGYDDCILPDVLVSFEVFEHLPPADGRRLLQHMLKLTSADCHYFISTPCWDRVNAAENHLNETTYLAFGALLEDLGFKIWGVWGTFASQKDYKHLMESQYPGITKIFADLSEYYDSTVISTTFAPLFPAQSRNCLWHLTRGTLENHDMFGPLIEQPTPWSQHPNWVELSGHSHYHRMDCMNQATQELICGKEGIWLKP